MAAADASPGVMTSPPYTEQHVADKIKEWVAQQTNAHTETHVFKDVVSYIESIVGRPISCLETTWIERQYVKIVLEMWLRASFEKAFADLEDQSSNYNTQISELLQQLKLINSFEDIRLKLPAESKLRDWCQCRYLQLILGQTSLFKTTPCFAILVPSYFQHFKTSLADQILSRSRKGLTEDQINFISALTDFLDKAINGATNFQDILVQNFLENEFGKESLKHLVDTYNKVALAPDRFHHFQPLADESWTSQLKLQIKEICKTLLLPETVVDVQNEDGKEIISIKGVAVFVSKILQEMIDLKRQNSNVKEIKIVGILSVHVDCDLESKDWHGMNVGIVTDKIYVDIKKVRWDVSGQHGNDQPEGKRGEPGESGGNIHVICEEMINAEKWTIISDGGDGRDGQTVRKIGPDGKETFHRKWSKEEFQNVFPTMSTFDDSANERAMGKVLKTLKEILPVNTRIKGEDVVPGYRNDFYIWGTTKEDSEMQIIHRKGKKTRHTLIYSKGCNKVGQGGYGGSITIEHLNSEEAENKMRMSVPLVGRDGQQPSAVRMDVYEASGSVGSTGKPAGDVGFIHSVKKNDKKNEGKGNYFGFDNDVILKFEERDDKNDFKKANVPYVKFNKISKKDSYASISFAGHDDFPRELKHSLAMKETVKMKAIIRQNLVQHLTEIDERKQMTRFLKTTISNSMEQQSDCINKLIQQIDQKQAKLYRLSCQRSQQRQELRQCYVKPSSRTVKVQKSLSSFTTPVKPNGRRPVDLQLNLPKITCLDLLPTANGNDSALHSILGRMNSAGLYDCADTDKFRQHLANFLKNENEANQMIAVKNFVLRQNDEAFPFASARKKEFLTFRQQNGGESQFDWLQTPELSEEYASFIQTPLGALDLPEVECLAKVLDLTIHVYEDQHDSSSFKHKFTFNPDCPIEQKPRQKHFILYKGGGEWQRLEANENLQEFCNQLPMELLQSVQQQTNSFSTLIGLLTKWNHHDLIASIEMLNPEDGVTPDRLSQLLLEKHFNKLLTAEGEKNDAAISKQLNELVPDIRLLTERVLEYNLRNVSPVFYLYVVSKCTEPKDWKYEFLLLEMEERLTKHEDNMHGLKKEILTSLKNLDDQTVAVLRKSLIMATDFGDCLLSTMIRILKMLPVKSGSNENDSEQIDQLRIELSLLSQLPLNDWLYELRSKIWERKVNQLTAGDDLRHGELETLMKEAVYLLLELEYQKGETFCKKKIVNIKKLPKLVDRLREALYPCTDSTERDWETIITIIKNEDTRLLFSIKQLGCIKRMMEYSKSKQPEIGENLKILTKKLHTKLRNIGNSSTMTDERFSAQTRKTVLGGNELLLAEYLHVYDSVVRIENKNRIQLRDTQRVAIMFLINHFLIEKNILVQVSTGEGKSLIVAGVAIFCALTGLKVDVVTSNDVLALRDSTLSVADGGLRDIYEHFNVGVANNCSQSQDDRVKAYNSAVVYGELANFQRDYLLDTFYGLNVRGDRTMDFVIVDEVDCLLLDRGSNTLYLSHDIPGMEMLESLYVFIWERMKKSVQLDDIKSQVLYDLYGAITKNDLEKIHAPLKEKPSEKNELWHYLIQAKIIDPNGRLLIRNLEENKIDYKENPSLNPKLIFFFRKVIERESHIRIPEHLLAFVDRHLDTWLANALRATELNQDEDYVIDQDRTDTSPDLNPQVIIIDPDTGTDQTTSQWDGALHQFLQLKEGCKLTLQSLKAVFISNEEYIKKYKRLAGVSGTLGSLKERDYMMKSYKCDYVSIPTAFSKRFRFKTPKVLKTKESWLSSIIKEMEEKVLTKEVDKARSIVIFCQTIKDVNIVHNHIQINLPQLIADKKVHRYIRDYEQFDFEAKQLEIGHVIIATNLAGRGTDIKISDELSKNGGLHICLTYLPLNERITEQAMGRSGRKGAPGSGILILFQSPAGGIVPKDTEWSVAKFFSMKGERNREELQRIARLQEDSKKTENQIKCFDIFSNKYNNLKTQIKKDKEDEDVDVDDVDVVIRLMCDSALDQWALWLDETDDLNFGFDHREYLNASLIDKLQLSESPCGIDWMLPCRSVALAKYLAQKESGINFVFDVLPQDNLMPIINGQIKKVGAREISATLLEKLAESNDAFFYPAAPYYLAFLIIKEKKREKKQTRIAKMLRRSETILSEHIRMQMSFYRKINPNLSQSHSFCAIDSYKQQKVNIANLLGHYINSIRTLLGSHYCSASDLEQAGIDGQKVDKLFEQLKTDCIVQPKLNDNETIPNEEAVIQQIAKIHNVVDEASLRKKLSSVFNNLSKSTWDETDIEREIKKEIEISFTRKSFWKNMIKERVMEDEEDFVIMDESECDIEAEADENEELRIDFASKDYVFFKPIPYTKEEMKKKIVFRKQYVKNIFETRNHLEYHRRKKKFEFNKRGRLNLIELEKINKKYMHQTKVNEDDLRGIHINPDERKGILAELVIQKIIDDQGYLAPEYNGEEFRYPQCPAYEDAVMGLLWRKFANEIVTRQWLNSNEEPELLRAIELLPLNPHRNLLADLMASHVIAGARVKDDLTDIDIIKAVEKITDELIFNNELSFHKVFKRAIEKMSKEEHKKLDEEERKKLDEKESECLLNYLRSRQALYVPTRSTEDFSLDFIENEIRTQKGMDIVSAELFLFGLVGFDHHIIYKNKLSYKTAIQGSISTVVGFGQVFCGSLLDVILLGVPSMFGFNFLVTGGKANIFNGIENMFLRNKSTWTDYGRQSLRNLVEKPDHFEKISTILKIISYIRPINQTPSLPSSFSVQDPILTEYQNVRIVATTNNKLNHRYRLIPVSHLVETINKTVDRNMAKIKETFNKVWQSHNHEDIKRLVKEKMEKLVTDWLEKGKIWVSEVKEAEIKHNQLVPTINKHLEGFAFKIRHVTMECLKRFRKDLEQDFSKLQMTSTLTIDHFDVEMGERFYKKVVENMKSELARKAEQIMELFPTEIDSSIMEREDVCARRLEATSGNASRTNKSPFLLDFLCLLSITFSIIYIFIKIFLSF